MAPRLGANLALAHLLLDLENHPLYESNIEQVFSLADLDVNHAVDQAVKQPLALILGKFGSPGALMSRATCSGCRAPHTPLDRTDSI